VIGLGILCGFQLPENFNRPYLAQNFLDLWSRWHITLSEWFKFYLFNPVLKTLAERWPSPKLIPYFGAVAFFITFTIMGIWHGSTPIFLIYGAALGIGAAGNKLFQIYAVSRLGKKRYRALSERAWYRHFSRGATLAFFTVGVACVWITPEIAALIMRVGGVELVSLSFGFLLLVYAFLSWLADLVSRVRLPTVESFRRPDCHYRLRLALSYFLSSMQSSC
jgi:D-alanyl-lipoteichoic acid acyltransferase DltB (MBOAT superfamily)